jgi:3-oxoacyl-(acyl-carrier-protein) synthase
MIRVNGKSPQSPALVYARVTYRNCHVERSRNISRSGINGPEAIMMSKEGRREIQPFTVRGILDEELARKSLR